VSTESSSRLLRQAVKNSNRASRKGFLQSLFSIWFDALVYNQIWEDPRVDLQALELGPDSRVITISSGGCNALNYLLADPASVTAVDLNRHHASLLKLKVAAVEGLPEYEQFFTLFGRGKGGENVANFRKYVAPRLDADTREYWESRFGIRRKRRIELFGGRGIYDHSRNGYFLRFFHLIAHLHGCRPELVLEAKSMEEQEKICARHLEPFFDSAFMRLVGKMPVTLFGLGIPPQQYDELKKDLEGDGGIIEIYRERAHRLAAGFPVGDNYFTWQALGRHYDTEKRQAVPEYLKKENWAKLRANIRRIGVKVGSVTDEIRDRGPGAFSRFVFLDAQDWMKPDAVGRLWSLIAEMGAPGSRIIFRTAGRRSPVEGALPGDIRRKFTYHERLSAELFAQDRASIYGGFHLYTLE
jgi:S-adenosylmethionine-diacylglycerol 3-amino-3-carboxypropyl transferase